MGKRKSIKKKLPPEVLISTDEYLEAPVGTIAAADGDKPVYKAAMADECPDEWEIVGSRYCYPSSQVAGTIRKVLRWGWVANG